MWEEIETKFQNYPSRLKVAKLYLEYGICLRQVVQNENKKLIPYCGPIQLSITSIAKAAGVDRKVVEETGKAINEDKILNVVFSRLKPVADISDVARYQKHYYQSILEVHALPASGGIAALATQLLNEEGVVIRYLLAKDADLSVESTMTIVCDKKIPSKIIDKLLQNNNVIAVTLS